MLVDEPSFPIQTNQFELRTTNHLLEVAVTYIASISPALNHPNIRYQTTGTALSPRVRWNYSDILMFAFLRLAFPTENITKTVTCVWPPLLSSFRLPL